MIAEPTVNRAMLASINTSDDIAISVQGVGKMYRIYERAQDRLKQMLLWRFGRSYGHEFWALRNISLEIRRGETIGIIGRNGSGKSTLLQIIAGTLAPTEGEVQVNGRVAALLELGSGFNPDFTGRENVFLNGSILGIARAEMEAHFDDIVAFADIGNFIDQPVKTYSSGMVVRLAFAVQVYVPKDILIVDEALAVGDMFFQAKCMSHMRKMLDEGVTILYVSHEINSVRGLCQRALWLDSGRVKQIGTTEEVIGAYSLDMVQQITDTNEQFLKPLNYIDTNMNSLSKVEKATVDPLPSEINLFRRGNGMARFSGVRVETNNEELLGHYAEFGQNILIRMVIDFIEPCTNIAIGYHIRNLQGQPVIGCDTLTTAPKIYGQLWKPEENLEISFSTKLLLQAGVYSLNLLISSFNDHNNFADVVFLDWVENVHVFEVARRADYPIFDMVQLDHVVHWSIIQKYSEK